MPEEDDRLYDCETEPPPDQQYRLGDEDTHMTEAQERAFREMRDVRIEQESSEAFHVHSNQMAEWMSNNPGGLNSSTITRPDITADTLNTDVLNVSTLNSNDFHINTPYGNITITSGGIVIEGNVTIKGNLNVDSIHTFENDENGNSVLVKKDVNDLMNKKNKFKELME